MYKNRNKLQEIKRELKVFCTGVLNEVDWNWRLDEVDWNWNTG